MYVNKMGGVDCDCLLPSPSMDENFGKFHQFFGLVNARSKPQNVKLCVELELPKPKTNKALPWLTIRLTCPLVKY